MSRNDPVTVAKAYLAAMEARDLERATALLASPCRLVFPGGSYSRLDEMVRDASVRYRWVKKRFESADLANGEGIAVVYLCGTLYGVDIAGQPFEGVRFIDRLEIEGGLIRRQDVWNDFGYRLLS